jgi:hypothetical protein
MVGNFQLRWDKADRHDCLQSYTVMADWQRGSDTFWISKK